MRSPSSIHGLAAGDEDSCRQDGQGQLGRRVPQSCRRSRSRRARGKAHSHRRRRGPFGQRSGGNPRTGKLKSAAPSGHHGRRCSAERDRRGRHPAPHPAGGHRPIAVAIAVCGNARTELQRHSCNWRPPSRRHGQKSGVAMCLPGGLLCHHSEWPVGLFPRQYSEDRKSIRDRCLQRHQRPRRLPRDQPLQVGFSTSRHAANGRGLNLEWWKGRRYR